MWAVETCARAKGALGKQGRKVDGGSLERSSDGNQSIDSVGNDYTGCRRAGKLLAAEIRVSFDLVYAMLAALQRGVKGGMAQQNKRWPNAYFADLGLFTMYEAHQLACQSR